jgi:hypothetical protein
MINKDFTLYPEALELKQLGFDEPCLFYYYGSNDLQSLIQIDMPRLVNHNESILGTCYSAPSYSQAFRWFRNKYDLYADIYRIGKKFNAGIEDMNIGSSKETVVEGVDYEEAELACLRKLIELVKNK